MVTVDLKGWIDKGFRNGRSGKGEIGVGVVFVDVCLYERGPLENN